MTNKQQGLLREDARPREQAPMTVSAAITWALGCVRQC